MARLIAALIRHGDYHQLPDTPSAHQPFPLTDTGRQQALRAVTKLQLQAGHEHWQIAETIHSSELLRAWETARIISEHLDGGHKVTAFADLAERGMGSAANLTIGQIEEIVLNDPRVDVLPEDWKSNSRFRLPLQGAESLLEAGERVAGHLSRTMAELAQQATEDSLQVFVGHGAAIRHAAYVLGILRFDEIARLSMYHADPVYFEYSAHSWQHVAGNWKVRDQKHELD